MLNDSFSSSVATTSSFGLGGGPTSSPAAALTPLPEAIVAGVVITAMAAMREQNDDVVVYSILSKLQDGRCALGELSSSASSSIQSIRNYGCSLQLTEDVPSVSLSYCVIDNLSVPPSRRRTHIHIHTPSLCC